MSDGIEYFRRDRDHCMVGWSNLLLWFSVGEVGPEQVAEMTRYFDVMAERHPDGFAFVLYARDNCKLPDAAGRRAASQMFAKQKDRLSGMVALFAGHGFFMASARAILSTMLALARQPFEARVSGEVEESMRWLCERTPGLRDMPDAAARAEAVLAEVARAHAELVSSAA